MLTKLVLIKACTYDLAELDFRHGDAMQLVGGNNVGKSSLIYALNFLFVINRKRMSFMGEKTADKATMEYYFPTAENSFLVFEICKRERYYCVVVWRDSSGAPVYGLLRHAYQRELFFANDEEEGLAPLSLTGLRRKWLLAGIDFKLLKNNQEIAKVVYHTGKANDAAVWLRNSGHGGGAKGFSKLYRYLINTRLIDDSALREILLLADHRSETRLSYGNSSMSDIDRLRKSKKRVDMLRREEGRFERFRSDHQQLAMDEAGLLDLTAAYHYYSTERRAAIETEKIRDQERINENQQELNHLQASFQGVQREIGGLQAQRNAANNRQLQLQAQLEKIQALPTEDFLLSSRENLQQRQADLQFQLTEQGQIQVGQSELEQRIQRRAARLQLLTDQRDNLSNWLIFKLAENETDRRRLNAILHATIARMDAAALREKVSNTASFVQLFDGAFELPTDFELPDLPTPEQVAAELAEVREQQHRDERLLEATRNRTALEKQLRELQIRLRDLERELQQLGNSQKLEAEIADLGEQLTQLDHQLEERESESRRLQEELRLRNNAQDIIKDKLRERDGELQSILTALRKLEQYQLPKSEEAFVPTSSEPPVLKRLFAELERTFHATNELRTRNRADFKTLRQDLLSETADEKAFIEEIEQDYAGLDDQEQAITSLVDSIGQRFANPAADFLHQYEQFQTYIQQQFNRKLARLSISNIESMKIELVPNERLQGDLRKIGELDLSGNTLFASERGGMSVLRSYIEQGKDIAFSELFSLKLKLTIAGKEKTVDLSKQVESDGTDRMLRLVIVMQVISQLVHLSPDNRIVMFIDEIATIDGKNRPQLVAFCREHHFYPIFAAPEEVEGFDRYVFIMRNPGGKIIVRPEQHYVDVERNVAESVA